MSWIEFFVDSLLPVLVISIGVCAVIFIPYVIYLYKGEKKYKRKTFERRSKTKTAHINGLMYDTSKATLVFEDENILYYATSHGNYFHFNLDDDEIVTMTLEEFKDDYANIDLEKYIAMFGEPEEA